MQQTKGDVKIIKASTALQKKIGTGTLDMRTVDRAQKVIENNKVDFAPIAAPQLDLLQKAVLKIQAGQLTGFAALEGIMEPIMNLKANAALFNYPFISILTGMVLDFLETVKTPDSEILKIVDNLQKTVAIVVAKQIKTADSPLGAQLLAEFTSVCKRYSDRRLG